MADPAYLEAVFTPEESITIARLGTPRWNSQEAIAFASSTPSLPMPPLTIITGQIPSRYSFKAFSSLAARRREGTPVGNT